MDKFVLRLVRLMVGLFICAVGVVLIMKADLGYAPWEVFHSGIAKTIGLSIGTVCVLFGVVLVGLATLFGETLGIGTVLNMIFIGTFIDVVQAWGIIHTGDGIFLQVLMLLGGLFTIAIGTYFYMGSAFGAGPRDSLMTALARKTGKPAGLCKVIVEISAVAIGFCLGGEVGVGTVVAAFFIGVTIQLVFHVTHFDVTKIENETIKDTFEKHFKKKSA